MHLSVVLFALSRLVALTRVIQGSGGGPLEDNVTGLLVRSTSRQWAKGSVLAVDAGTHLAAVTNIIQEHLPKAVSRRPSQPSNGAGSTLFSPQPGGRSTDVNGITDRTTLPDGDNAQSTLVLSSGPFTDFQLPYTTAKANAAHFVRNLITTYLITHPHLDHISGFVINTAGFQHTSRPKRLAGLPSTIDAFKTHIFNDIIWPNLSDEEGGVGLVSYMRLAEGGNLAIGEGEARGYIEVCDGLAVKGWSVSHGKCMHNHGKRASGSGHTLEQFSEPFSRRPSASATTPNSVQHGREHFPVEPCVIDSSAFFLRDDHSGHEVIIFGDVEPDSLSISPRTQQVWADAAPKVASGLLKGILIESSYDESQSDETLFGHLAPRHIIAELQTLAGKVIGIKSGNREATPLKRKRASNGLILADDLPSHTRKSRHHQQQRPRRKSRKSNPSPVSMQSESERERSTDGRRDSGAAGEPDVPHSIQEVPNRLTDGEGEAGKKPLEGLQVIIIHVKDNLKDHPDAGDTILAELEEMERVAGLGCTFAISKSGTSIWL